MELGIQTLTLNTSNLDSMGKLFAAMGFQLQQGKVDKGSDFLRGRIGFVELTLMSIPQMTRAESPGIGLRIQVQNIEKVLSTLRELEKIQIIMDVEYLHEGKTALVLDPDGRSIEICG